MREYWQPADDHGMHPSDVEFLREHSPRFERFYKDWDLATALRHTASLPPSRVLHVGLHPQPFLGNIQTPLIQILHGNPGFSFHDYYDEFMNSQHAAACAQNLRNADLGFFPLDEMANTSGAQNYWLRAFKRTIADLSAARGIDPSAARQILKEHVGLIESCAYHSTNTPGEWTDLLPSSVKARERAQLALNRARNGQSLVIVWRRVGANNYWQIEAPHPNIMIRTAQDARSSRILPSESAAIVQFLRTHLPI
jgi:hypothetical protein